MDKVNLNTPQIGMKLGSFSADIKQGEYALLVNGNVESVNGNWLKITNEPANLLCSKLNGFKLLGSYPVPSMNLTFVAIVNTINGDSEIGYIKDSNVVVKEDEVINCKDCEFATKEPTPLELTEQKEMCNYYTVVSAKCLKFSIDFPVKFFVKVDDCNIRLYFIDDNNPFRYIDFPDFQKITEGECPKSDTEELDCDKIKIFKDACYPQITSTNVVAGGESTAGVYQFLTAYADAYSNPITSYYYATNPIPLFDQSKTITINTDYPVSKAIKLHIEGLNTDFDWINLVVLRTVNLVTVPFLVGTFSNSSSSFDYTFTGIEANLKQNLSLENVLSLKPVYDKANIIAESNGTLLLGDVTEPRILNLQPFVNKLNLQWQTVEFDEGAFANPIVAQNYRCFLRDEVVPFSIEFWRTNGVKTARFHIPGREAISTDLQDVSFLSSGAPNPDVFSDDACITPSGSVPRWKVYNTAAPSGYACGYTPNSDDCDYPITETTTCEGESFYQSPSGSYYADYNSATNTYSNPILNPCSDVFYKCNNTDDCLNSIRQQYGDEATITFLNCSVIVKEYGQTQIVYEYSPSGGFIETPSYPASGSFSPITNIDCASSIATTTCENPVLAQMQDSGGGTETLWYSFFSSSTVQAVTITSVYNQTDGNNFTLNLYESSNGYCSGIGGVIYTVTQDNPYFLLQNLTVGAQYYVTITGDANVTANVNDFYYICSIVPDPISSQIITLPNIVATLCNYSVEFCVNYNPCIGIPYQKGIFSYWESTELYPCNNEVWGDLAGKPVRHHKFPDCLISPHYRNINHQQVTPALSNYSKQDLFNTKTKIYPIGVIVDVEEIKNLLLEAQASGYLSEKERKSICGYRVVRGDRRGNESIISKGLIYDVWKYRDNVYKTDKDTLYPNYPYNSIQDDEFNLQKKLENVNSPVLPIEHPFKAEGYVNNKYTFLGANTLFNNPGLGTELKLELEAFGVSEGKYTEVINHPKYQYAGIGAVRAAYCLASLQATFDTIAAINAGGIVTAAVLSSIASMMWGTKIPPNYYDWLDVIKKLSPFRNFAWYYTSTGNYADFVPSDNLVGNVIVEGNTRRGLNSAQYLNQGISTVADGANRLKFNNYKRESSVYLNINDTFNITLVEDSSRWYPGDQQYGGNCANPTIGNVYTPISSFYSSLKTSLPNQYGQIDQIQYIDTGHNGTIDWLDNTQDTLCNTIFGGDTFINRFDIRRQLSFFINDVVGQQPGTDVQYNELSNIGYPQFFFSYPQGNVMTGQSINSAVSSLYGDVVLRNTARFDYNFPCPEDQGQGIFNMALQAIGLSQLILSMNAISGIGALITNAKIFATFDFNNNPVFPGGKFFLYSYGVPSFITESNYNLDLRYGTNQKEGNFSPNISDIVSWTQPTAQYNIINYDNTYNYNLTYSKQNHENNGYVLNPDFNQVKEDCKVNHSNRVIYSLADNDNNDRFDGNRVFLANNYYDLPKSAGKLAFIKGIDTSKILIVQENQASVFNSFSTLQADIKNVAVGSGAMFQSQLAQYVKTDLGYGGSQTQANVTTEFGTFWVDNKRGQIFKMSGNIEDISLGENQWWFKEFLPFKILLDFPDINITNNFKYFGMTITYDQRMKRVLFTKRDAKLRPEYKNKVIFNGFEFIYNNKTIFPNNSEYFCNQSWTIAYSPLFKNFVSFQSYTPNTYLPNQSYFSSVVNYPTTDEQTGVWNHLLTNQSYTCFFGKKYPFIFEYSLQSEFINKILNSIEYKVDYNRFINQYDFYKVDKSYDQALIYSQKQNSGTLELLRKQKNNLYQNVTYANKFTSTSKQILVENVEDYFRVNNFYNLYQGNNQPSMAYYCLPYKEINNKSVFYKPQFLPQNLRNDFFNIRLSDTTTTNFQIVNNFILTETSISNI